MEIDKVGIFKDPGSARPLAFEMFKQMKRDLKELVAIRESRKIKPIPALNLLRRRFSIFEKNFIVVRISYMNFY